MVVVVRNMTNSNIPYTIPTILPPRYGMLFDFAAMHPFGYYINDRKVHPNLPHNESYTYITHAYGIELSCEHKMVKVLTHL